jgi:hypothetical protein
VLIDRGRHHHERTLVLGHQGVRTRSGFVHDLLDPQDRPGPDLLGEIANAEAAVGTSLDDHEDGHMISLPPESGDTRPLHG